MTENDDSIPEGWREIVQTCIGQVEASLMIRTLTDALAAMPSEDLEDFLIDEGHEVGELMKVARGRTMKAIEDDSVERIHGMTSYVMTLSYQERKEFLSAIHPAVGGLMSCIPVKFNNHARIDSPAVEASPRTV